MLFKNSVRTSTRTSHFTIRKFNWLHRRLNRESYKTHKYKIQSDWVSKQLVYTVTVRLWRVTTHVPHEPRSEYGSREDL